MSVTTFDLFLSEALNLPMDQRSRLATVLIDSLDVDDSSGLSSEWTDEIARRASELDSGQVQPMSFEAFRTYVEERVA